MTIFTTSIYERNAKRLLKSGEKAAMEQAIAADPENHPVIPGLGGARKARWSRQGMGKRGGVRTIYYYYRAANSELHFVLVYAKNEQTDLTPEQWKQVTKVVEVIKHGKKGNN